MFDGAGVGVAREILAVDEPRNSHLRRLTDQSCRLVPFRLLPIQV